MNIYQYIFVILFNLYVYLKRLKLYSKFEYYRCVLWKFNYVFLCLQLIYQIVNIFFAFLPYPRRLQSRFFDLTQDSRSFTHPTATTLTESMPLRSRSASGSRSSRSKRSKSRKSRNSGSKSSSSSPSQLKKTFFSLLTPWLQIELAAYIILFYSTFSPKSHLQNPTCSWSLLFAAVSVYMFFERIILQVLCEMPSVLSRLPARTYEMKSMYANGFTRIVIFWQVASSLNRPTLESIYSIVCVSSWAALVSFHTVLFVDSSAHRRLADHVGR